MNITNKIEITNECNMSLMSRYPDNYFDLAIIDPPYGLSKTTLGGYLKKSADTNNMNRLYKENPFDDGIPDKAFFEQLFRVSKNQIIWGGNYMAHLLPPSRGWIYWDKVKFSKKHSSGELAWTSFDKILKEVKIQHHGFLKNKEEWIHSTQKPITLYEWILDNYAKNDFKILDTNLGSGSHACAVYNNKNVSLVACEKIKDIYDKSLIKIQNHIENKIKNER